MLTRLTASKRKATRKRFAIVASKYNARYVDAMLKEARAVLRKSGAEVDVIRVPGAFEIPTIAAKLASPAPQRFAAIICLGVILQGETAHAQHIGEAVSQALMEIQIAHHVPVIHEVLLLQNEAQAKVRCLGKEHNRGAEAAHTAIEMAAVMDKADELISTGSRKANDVGNSAKSE